MVEKRKLVNADGSVTYMAVKRLKKQDVAPEVCTPTLHTRPRLSPRAPRMPPRILSCTTFRLHVRRSVFRGSRSWRPGTYATPGGS